MTGDYSPDTDIVDPREWDDVPTSPGVVSTAALAAEARARLDALEAEREFDADWGGS